MKISPIKTAPIVAGGPSLEQVVDRYLPQLPDGTILAVASKIVAICEGRIIPEANVEREALIQREADYYRSPSSNPAHFHNTIKSGFLVTSAGIDLSNGNGQYVLWPANPQASANHLRAHVATRHHLQRVGVIITDSHSAPLRRGATGVTLAHSGFAALRSYVGQPDLFGRRFISEVANLADGLAAAAVAVMGEGAAATPLALIDHPPVEFQPRDPTEAEIQELKVPLDQDVYTEMLRAIPWDKRPKHD